MGLLSTLTRWVTETISALGYPGILAAMILESALIPIPSELIMTFGGYLAWQGRFNIWIVIVLGGLGNLIGSQIAYELGQKKGRRWLLAVGKYILLSEEDLDTATRWLKRWGTPVAFFSRFMPGVRTYVSFPAGMSRIPRLRFAIYTFLGSLGWSAVLAGVGYGLGPSWEKIGTYLHGLDAIVLLLLVVGAVWYIRRHVSSRTLRLSAKGGSLRAGSNQKARRQKRNK